MTIRISCECGRALKVRDEMAGKRIKCPVCGVSLPVPMPEPPPDDGFVIKEELPEQPEAPAPPPSANRVLKLQQQDWEQDRSVIQIILEMFYRPFRALDNMSAYIGKPSVKIGFFAFFVVSLAAAAIDGLLESTRPTKAREVPVELPLTDAQVADIAQAEQAWLEAQRKEFQERAAAKGAFVPIDRKSDPGWGPWTVTLRAEPERLIQETPFTLHLKLEHGSDAKMEGPLRVRIAGPLGPADGESSRVAESDGATRSVEANAFTYEGMLARPGDFKLRISSPESAPVPLKLEVPLEVGWKGEPPLPNYLKAPGEREPEPPWEEEGAGEPVDRAVKVVAGSALIGMSITISFVQLLVAAALVELASRLWGSGSEFVFMTAVLALVQGVYNVVDMAVASGIRMGGLDEWRVFFLWIPIGYRYVLTWVAVSKVYHMNLGEAALTCVVAGILQDWLSILLVAALFSFLF